MIALIAAMTKSGVIGKGNQLPWNIPDELKHFKNTTKGCTVIMGKRTFESIGRPLPNRQNIVLCEQRCDIPGVVVCCSVEEALSKAHAFGTDIFIIGGAHTYAQFLPLVDYAYISYIQHDYEGDVYFPAVDWSTWLVLQRSMHPEFEFVLYEREKP